VRDSEPFWKGERRALDRGIKAMRRGGPEAAADLASILDRIAFAAGAADERGIERRARSLRRGFSRAQAFDRDRLLLSRLDRMGLRSTETIAALTSRWEEAAEDRLQRARDDARCRPMRRLRKKLARASRNDSRLFRRLERARRQSSERAVPVGSTKDRVLRRYRKTLRRIASLDSVLSGAGATAPAALPESRLAEHLERWHAARSLRKRLKRERWAARRRGAVTLILELDRAIAAIEAAGEASRREALTELARASANVVRFQRRTA
jgi:hypothetical protein